MQEVRRFLSTHGLFCSASFAELGDKLSFLDVGWDEFCHLLPSSSHIGGDVQRLGLPGAAAYTHPVDAASWCLGSKDPNAALFLDTDWNPKEPGTWLLWRGSTRPRVPHGSQRTFLRLCWLREAGF